MREIKFRGKTKKWDNWVVGDLRQFNPFGKNFEANEDKECFIIQDESVNGGTEYKIISETVGQYTGLKDKNGTEIYEGDIFTSSSYPFQDEDQRNYNAEIWYDDESMQWCYELHCVNKEKRGISHGISSSLCDAPKDMKVIGNIHDNPELLEVENEIDNNI